MSAIQQILAAAVKTKAIYLAVAHGTTPFVTAYPWSASGFGTKLTNPGTLPAGTGNSIAFSPLT